MDEAFIDLSSGTKVGRHVVLRSLGSPYGMTFEAYDVEHDRKVVLKLAHSTGDTPRVRFCREAGVMAKMLSHPAIVQVLDVGVFGEHVWLAMEHVRGQSLDRWLDSPRSWRFGLAVMRAAGLVLAAAHRLGFVHGGFEAGHVLLGEGGRVHVKGFGFATLFAWDALHEDLIDRALASIRGIPRSLAPEQIAGQQATAASDQFAFCVTLWQVLHREHPFEGGSVMQMLHDIHEGIRRPPPAGSDVPAWVQRACERGLSKEPAQRWPSMEDLFAALVDERPR